MPERLTGSPRFRFDALAVTGIDNSPAVERFGPGIREQETCLLHDATPSGDACVALLSERVRAVCRSGTGTPVVRFADGEYAFYAGSLRCNGLYEQAESSEAIRRSIPAHAEDLRYVAGTGLLAPLVFPGNIGPVRRKFPAFWKRSGDDGAARFLEFLRGSRRPARRDELRPVLRRVRVPHIAGLRGRRGRQEGVHPQFGHRPGVVRRMVFRPVVPSLAGTRADPGVLRRHPMGLHEGRGSARGPAGRGAVPGRGRRRRPPGMRGHIAPLSIPALDAGHALNMMNDMEKKSMGPRLYSVHR